MCGLGGIIAARGARVDRSAALTLSNTIAHRGPDDVGYLSLANGQVRVARDLNACDAPAELYLVHRRLAIIDITESGWQPMQTRDGRYSIVYNGEIYNYVELREELEALGETFHSTSDTEVLLVGYARWGRALLPRLIGMFALAIYDAHERRLFLARDFFGIKPLYYTTALGGFAFSSEIKPLLRLGTPRRADPDQVYLYLRHGVTDGTAETLFSAIHQVEAAHWLEVRLDDLSIERGQYWQYPDGRTTIDISFDDAAKRLRELFVDAVRLHLRSDVPVGAALSGGIDSSAIVSAMRAIVGSSLDIHTFTYVARGTPIDEEKWADMVVERTNANAWKVVLGPDDLRNDLPLLIETQEQPFGSTSIFAQLRVFRLAKEKGIKVMLDGQGADEMLGGYRSFFAARLDGLLRGGRFGAALRFTRSVSSSGQMSALNVAKTLGQHVLPMWAQHPFRAAVGKELFPAWLDAEWFRARGVHADDPSLRNGRGLRSHLRGAATATVLPSLLRYEDRNSMIHSIESRVPFLTPQLAEFVMSLPDEYIISNDGVTKSVFRAAMRGLVPDAILDRRDKIGFATPEQSWLSELRPWKHAILTDPEVPRMIRVPAVKAELDAFDSGRRAFHFGVWRVINLAAWAKAMEVEL